MVPNHDKMPRIAISMYVHCHCGYRLEYVTRYMSFRTNGAKCY